MENLDPKSINDLLAGKSSIKVGFDTQDLVLLGVIVIGAIVIGGLMLAMIKRAAKLS